MTVRSALRRNRMLIALAVLAAAGLTVFAVTTGSTKEMSSRPPWADEHGRVNVNLLPERVPVVDSEGNIAGTVDRDALLRRDGTPVPVTGPDGTVVGELQPGKVFGSDRTYETKVIEIGD